MYYVYILSNKKDGRKYVGMTSDLRRRIKEHSHSGVKSTSVSGPYRLIWYCVFPNKQKALSFEKYLKSSSGHAFANKRFI